MKTHVLFLLIFIIMVTACAPQDVATPVPTPAFTDTTPPTVTPRPTQTLEPTPIPIQVTKISTEACSELVDTTSSNAGALEVIYTQRGSQFFELPEGFTGFTPGDNNTKLWLWNEERGKTRAILLPSDAVGPRISADHRWIVFRRVILKQDFGETQSELWVIDTYGQNEKKLASFSFDEVKTRNLDLHFDFASVDYGWVAGTNQIYYNVTVDGEDISVRPPTYDAFVLIDINSGKKIPLAQPGRAATIIFAPDGSQAAVLTDGKLNLVNAKDGSVQFTLPIRLRDSLGLVGKESLSYSPDGKYLIGFADDDIVRMNTKDGQWQTIPLTYTILTGGNGYAYTVGYSWVGNSTILVPLTNLPGGVSAINYDAGSRAKPELGFTLWEVNLVQGMSQQIQTFTGFANPDSISPDGHYVAFRIFETQADAPNGQFTAFLSPRAKLGGGSPPNMILADVNTGEKILTIEGISFFAWSPYSNYYVYVQRGESVNGVFTQPLYLGQIGADPIPFETTEKGHPLFYNVKWVDAQRFVMDLDCVLNFVWLPRQ